jgi:hypothetical protein
VCSESTLVVAGVCLHLTATPARRWDGGSPSDYAYGLLSIAGCIARNAHPPPALRCDRTAARPAHRHLIGTDVRAFDAEELLRGTWTPRPHPGARITAQPRSLTTHGRAAKDPR